MNRRMLGTVLQPFCGKCCGEHTKSGNVRQKHKARQIEKREVRKLVEEEKHSED